MKQVDSNGFWSIKNNPISKVGIFPYLGKQIDPSLEPDKIYMVLRPAEELFDKEAIDSFNANPVPLVDDHTMIGEDYTPAEKKGVDGVVNNIHQEGDSLVGDISIYSEDMKNKISNGKKDLSMGYFCTYDIQAGEYNGQHYDAVQRNIRSNHVALVDRGRCGHDVRVFDTWCFDCAIDSTDFIIEESEMEINDANFEESKHPRAENGQFTSGGGSSGGSAKPQSRKEKNTQEYINKKTKQFKEMEQSDLLTSENYDFKALHSKAQELAKMHLGTVTGHIRKDKTSGEIMCKKGDRRFKMTYKIAPTANSSGVQLRFGKIVSMDTASDGGCMASSDDADFQSKIKEIKGMIDKEKLAALKELVAMLESDEAPAGDAKPCDEVSEEIEEKIEAPIEEEKKEEVADESVDKRELIREIGAIAGKGGLSEEDVRTIMQKAEQLAYSDSEQSADDEDPSEIVSENKEEIVEEKKESEDELPQKIFEMIADRDALVNQVKPIIGNFNYSKMTAEQVAKYACDKLDINTDNYRAALDGYLKGMTKTKMYSIDSAAAGIETSNSQIEKYLKGE